MENTNEPRQNPQQVVSPPPPKKWFANKLVITLLILVILAALSLTVYLILNQPLNYGPIVVPHKPKQALQSSATSSPSQNDISNWQTYADTANGFSIDCPPGYITRPKL